MSPSAVYTLMPQLGLMKTKLLFVGQNDTCQLIFWLKKEYKMKMELFSTNKKTK